MTQQKALEVGNTRKVKALLKVLSNAVPYEVDVQKLSKSIGIERGTVLKYLKYLEEAKLIIRLFQNLDRVGDLQKPDKILLDNTNLMYVLADSSPVIGTMRECFFPELSRIQLLSHTRETTQRQGGEKKLAKRG